MTRKSSHDWKTFLTRWSQELITEERPRSDLPPEAVTSGWLGLPPAAAGQIAAAGARLGVKLPPSYREFVSVSNGWRFLANPYVEALRPVEEIEYFPVRMQWWLDVIRSAVDGASMQELYGIRDGELETTIELSESHEGTFLLNPNVITVGGEMEVWFFETESGVERFPSFWAMMQDDFALLLKFKERDGRRLKPGQQVETIVERLPGLIAELDEKAAEWRRTYPQNNFQLGGYELGILSVMDETRDSLRAMQSGPADPPALIEQIKRLTESMEQTWNKTWPKQRGPVAMVKGLADPGKSIYEGGRTEGMRETIAILRWFLSG